MNQAAAVAIVRDIVKTIEIRNPPFAIGPLLVEEDWSLSNSSVRVRYRYSAKDRDSGLPTDIHYQTTIDAELPRYKIERRLREALFHAFEHEFRECFHIDGVRVEDPHR